MVFKAPRRARGEPDRDEVDGSGGVDLCALAGGIADLRPTKP